MIFLIKRQWQFIVSTLFLYDRRGAISLTRIPNLGLARHLYRELIALESLDEQIQSGDTDAGAPGQLAYPIYSFILPVYSFWCFDE